MWHDLVCSLGIALAFLALVYALGLPWPKRGAAPPADRFDQPIWFPEQLEAPPSEAQNYLARRRGERGVSNTWATGAICLCFGIGIGMMLATRILASVPPATAANCAAIESSWEQTNAEAMKTVLAWKAADEKCEAQFGEATVLYDTSAAPNPFAIPLLHGTVNLSLAGTGPTPGPRWIIPAKIVPAILGSSTSAAYGYVDVRAGRIEGPFQPLPPGAIPTAQTSAPGGGQ